MEWFIGIQFNMAGHISASVNGIINFAARRMIFEQGLRNGNEAGFLFRRAHRDSGNGITRKIYMQATAILCNGVDDNFEFIVSGLKCKLIVEELYQLLIGNFGGAFPALYRNLRNLLGLRVINLHGRSRR